MDSDRISGDASFKETACSDSSASWERPEQAVLPLLHDAMGRSNYIREEEVREIARKTSLSPSDVLGIGTFYQFFSFHPSGHHVIRPCLTNPCLNNGGKKLFRALSRNLGIGIEETTSDGLFTLRPAQCLGKMEEAISAGVVDFEFAIEVSDEFKTFRDAATTFFD